MKTIGLIGGMSWESTVTYYQIVNRVVKERLGGLHSAKCLLYSVDFHDLEKCLATGDWDAIAGELSDAARRLQGAGADFLLICTNTMHKVADRVRAAVDIPLVHIAEATADALLERGVKRAGLLGTRYTMEQDFYSGKLAERGIETLIPDAGERERINDVIFNELCLGVIKEESKRFFLDAVGRLAKRGAEGIVLGCTEIGMLLSPDDTPHPLFDTTSIHASRAARMALEG